MQYGKNRRIPIMECYYNILIPEWYTWWDSDDSANMNERPLLTINYTPPAPPEPDPVVPEPATVLLILSGLLFRAMRVKIKK